MNISWLLNGSLEARHLAAIYVAVWVIQGGYVGWVAYQWARVGKPSS